MESLFRSNRLSEPGSHLTLESHASRSTKSVLFEQILNNYPELRVRLYQDHDIESLNPLTLEDANLNWNVLEVKI